MLTVKGCNDLANRFASPTDASAELAIIDDLVRHTAKSGLYSASYYIRNQDTVASLTRRGFKLFKFMDGSYTISWE